MKLVCLAFSVLLSISVLADEKVTLGEPTIILGKITRQYRIDSACSEARVGELDSICFESWVGFDVSVTTTLAGPPIARRVKVAGLQHGLLARDFQRSIRLLVLRPIKDADRRNSLKADYFLADVSPAERMYCLWQDPESYGLGERASAVHVSPGDNPRYCFELRDQR